MKKIKLLNIVGARPQIIKASAISRAIRGEFKDSVEEKILHTGQHYDRELSDVFFEELAIPLPDFNLGVGSARHGKQTASMISGIEEIAINEKPDAAIIYGDTNSTLAAAIACSKLHVPVAHIEAGMRSFKKRMPEEINRILADHVSTLLFAPTDEALKNLIREGFKPEASPPYCPDNPKIFHSGDIMYDNSLFYAQLAQNNLNGYLDKLAVEKDNFVLVTIHREINTDDIIRLSRILETLLDLAESFKIDFLMPLHPRTKHALNNNPALQRKLEKSLNIKVLKPVSYLEMIMLEKNARIIITDSGGVQKESHFFKIPCIVLRGETEWVELVTNGTAILGDSNPDMIKEAFEYYLKAENLSFPGFYGDGKAAEFIMKEISFLK